MFFQIGKGVTGRKSMAIAVNKRRRTVNKQRASYVHFNLPPEDSGDVGNGGNKGLINLAYEDDTET